MFVAFDEVRRRWLSDRGLMRKWKQVIIEVFMRLTVSVMLQGWRRVGSRYVWPQRDVMLPRLSLERRARCATRR